MTEEFDALQAALDRVTAAARAHLTAVRQAAGRVDDDEVWHAYVELNNASYAYDELLLDEFGEVTPWDVDEIDPDEADQEFGPDAAGGGGAGWDDPHPRVLSVRQRRDYRVPSVAALVRVAQAARRSVTAGDAAATVESIGEAVLELLQSGDGSLGALDIPELEPLHGVVTVTEVERAMDVDDFADDDGSGPFAPVPTDTLIGRLDEHPYVGGALDEDGEDTVLDEEESGGYRE